MDTPDDPTSDPFGPPTIPTLVGCLHCHQEYESYLIERRQEPDSDGVQRWWWCCPVPGCGGRGFGFDILPVDPAWRSEDGSSGWVYDEEDEEDDDEFDDEPDAPPPPKKDDDIDIPW